MNDIGNALFEFLGGVLLWLSVRRLWRDGEVKGVYWPAWFFYTGWGLWNLYYYPSLAQWYSLVGGIVVVTANLTWCVLAVRIWWRARK